MFSNRVTLIGFLGKDAEVKHPRNGGNSYTIFSLATKRSWKNRESGEWSSQTDWHRCVVFGKLSEYAATLTTGTHLQVEGDIRTREYMQKVGLVDAKKSITEVHVNRLTKMDRSAKPGAPPADAASEAMGVPA